VISWLGTAEGQIVFQAVADTLDVIGQTRVIEEIALAWLVSELGTAASGVLQGIERTKKLSETGFVIWRDRCSDWRFL